jgi:hypothetical protein
MYIILLTYYHKSIYKYKYWNGCDFVDDRELVTKINESDLLENIKASLEKTTEIHIRKITL